MPVAPAPTLAIGPVEVPIGLLVYANLVETHGAGPFYRAAAAAGVDSVLVADVPTLEAAPYAGRFAASQSSGVRVRRSSSGRSRNHWATRSTSAA